jgi:hypothetical protein
MEAAKRSSVNIPTGALETKSLISVNKETIRTCFLEKVMFSIKEKWTIEERGQPIFIEEDSAKVHISCDDAEFGRVASEDEFNIRLMRQPAN